LSREVLLAELVVQRQVTYHYMVEMGGSTPSGSPIGYETFVGKRGTWMVDFLAKILM